MSYGRLSPPGSGVGGGGKGRGGGREGGKERTQSMAGWYWQVLPTSMAGGHCMINVHPWGALHGMGLALWKGLEGLGFGLNN